MKKKGYNDYWRHLAFALPIGRFLKFKMVDQVWLGLRVAPSGYQAPHSQKTQRYFKYYIRNWLSILCVLYYALLAYYWK
jgi:hypothetical protein